jgi:hypothetical protein
MKRRLLFLNLVLLLALTWVGLRFRDVHNAARERETRVLGQTINNEKYPPLPAAPPVAPIVAANYLMVAERMVLSKDRNSTVVIEPPPVEEKVPMPPLPVAHGLMMMGEPGIILSERPGAVQKTYRKGEKVGPFQLLTFDNNSVVMDWNGEKVERRIEDLLEKSTAPVDAGAVTAPSGGVQQAAAPTPAREAQPLGPGTEIGGGLRACQPNDSLPSGAVQGGFRKVEVATPFGKSCRWEAVR